MAHGYALILPVPKPFLPVENRVRFAVGPLVLDGEVTASGMLERSGTKAMSKSGKGESRGTDFVFCCCPCCVVVA